MGMVMCLETASDKSIKQLLRKPDLIESWLSGDSEETEVSDEHIQVDLDKAWHAIHFLLCGSADGGDGPEAFLLAGGTAIGDIDVGYGPARAFRSDEIKAISKALTVIPPEALRARFNHALLKKHDIYPSIWDRNDPGDVDYTIEYYDTLLQHLNTAASKGMGMIVFLK
jgi:hypothetical protein